MRNPRKTTISYNAIRKNTTLNKYSEDGWCDVCRAGAVENCMTPSRCGNHLTQTQKEYYHAKPKK
jgi:hypothetical protein